MVMMPMSEMRACADTPAKQHPESNPQNQHPARKRDDGTGQGKLIMFSRNPGAGAQQHDAEGVGHSDDNPEK